SVRLKSWLPPAALAVGLWALFDLPTDANGAPAAKAAPAPAPAKAPSAPAASPPSGTAAKPSAPAAAQASSPISGMSQSVYNAFSGGGMYSKSQIQQAWNQYTPAQQKALNGGATLAQVGMPGNAGASGSGSTGLSGSGGAHI